LAHPSIEESGGKVKEGSRYSKCNTSGGHGHQEGITPKGIELVDVNLPTLQCDHDSLPGSRKRNTTHIPMYCLVACGYAYAMSTSHLYTTRSARRRMSTPFQMGM